MPEIARGPGLYTARVLPTTIGTGIVPFDDSRLYFTQPDTTGLQREKAVIDEKLSGFAR